MRYRFCFMLNGSEYQLKAGDICMLGYGNKTTLDCVVLRFRTKDHKDITIAGNGHHEPEQQELEFAAPWDSPLKNYAALISLLTGRSVTRLPSGAYELNE